MKVAIFSSEVYPFSKTGGLADVIGALPVYLKEKGVEVMVFSPFYHSVSGGGWALAEAGEREIILGEERYRAAYYRTNHRGVDFIFVNNPHFFDREYIYGSPETGYLDNGVRYAFFVRACLDYLRDRVLRPDVIQCNDWQTALAPVYLRSGDGTGFFRKTRTLLTIHNLKYQGIEDENILEKISLPRSLFSMEALEYYGRVNYLKGGIVFADGINTVSRKYAEEIRTPEFGEGLEGVINRYAHKLYGIVNGIDYEVWNPARINGGLIKYDENSLGRKDQNRARLLQELKLKGRKGAPLFGFVGRLDEQKGIELIVNAIQVLAKTGSPLVVHGTGKEHYRKALGEISRRYPGLVAPVIGYDEETATKVFAAADFLLVPSRYEPCGLTQLVAMKFGTIPVVRNTGGLSDTVSDYFSSGGWGVSFNHFDSAAFEGAIYKSICIYSDKSLLNQLRRKCMTLDFSWRSCAREYTQLYRQI